MPTFAFLAIPLILVVVSALLIAFVRHRPPTDVGDLVNDYMKDLNQLAPPGAAPMVRDPRRPAGYPHRAIDPSLPPDVLLAEEAVRRQAER